MSLSKTNLFSRKKQAIHLSQYFTDVKLCTNDRILELTAGLNTSIICEAERDVQWRLHVADRGTNTSFSLANCTEEGCTPLPFFPETFLASVKNNHTKLIIIHTENNAKIYDNVQLVNGVLECTSVNNVRIERSARCGLNYVCKFCFDLLKALFESFLANLMQAISTQLLD